MPIYVMNGKEKRRTAKSSAKEKKKMSSRTQNKKRKGGGKKRSRSGKSVKRRRPRSAIATVSRAPTKRRRSGGYRKKRGHRRSSNPSLGGLMSGVGPIVADIKGAIPRLIGKLAAVAAVKRFGGASGAIMGPLVTTPTRGESWTLQQYAIALGVGLFAPKIFGRFVNGAEFRRGVVDLIVEKVVWSELIARSPTAMQWLGAADGDVQFDPSTGQMWVQQGGQYVAMQGYGDTLVPQTQYGELVPANQYGHLLPPNVDALTARGQWDNSGFVNRFDAAYAAQR